MLQEWKIYLLTFQDKEEFNKEIAKIKKIYNWVIECELLKVERSYKIEEKFIKEWDIISATEEWLKEKFAEAIEKKQIDIQSYKNWIEKYEREISIVNNFKTN